ncbi:MAG: hypothetical protein HY319_31410 [Armatimonadetes bacterium]|nr:hypothetical protein [Armatimonadota bacterium]
MRLLALAVPWILVLQAAAAAEAGGMNLSVTLLNREGEEVRQSYFRYELAPGQSREDRILLRNMGISRCGWRFIPPTEPTPPTVA